MTRHETSQPQISRYAIESLIRLYPTLEDPVIRQRYSHQQNSQEQQHRDSLPEFENIKKRGRRGEVEVHDSLPTGQLETRALQGHNIVLLRSHKSCIMTL